MRLLALSLLALSLLASASCTPNNTPRPTQTSTSSKNIDPGVPGGVAVETQALTVHVVHVYFASREMILQTPDGQKHLVEAGPEIVNFDQIRAGDQIKVVVTEELAVSMAPASSTPEPGAAAVVVLAPKGGKPGGTMASTVQAVGTLSAIDLKNHRATLTFPDGTTHTVAVRSDVDLSQRKVGEKVVLRKTKSLVISLEKPST